MRYWCEMVQTLSAEISQLFHLCDATLFLRGYVNTGCGNTGVAHDVPNHIKWRVVCDRMRRKCVA